jgi:hypothetical protein
MIDEDKVPSSAGLNKLYRVVLLPSVGTEGSPAFRKKTCASHGELGIASGVRLASRKDLGELLHVGDVSLLGSQ